METKRRDALDRVWKSCLQSIAKIYALDDSINDGRYFDAGRLVDELLKNLSDMAEDAIKSNQD